LPPPPLPCAPPAPHAATRDFIAGMTDRYAVRLYEQLFIPKPWTTGGIE
jgi:hypothetical protein